MAKCATITSTLVRFPGNLGFQCKAFNFSVSSVILISKEFVWQSGCTCTGRPGMRGVRLQNRLRCKLNEVPIFVPPMDSILVLGHQSRHLPRLRCMHVIIAKVDLYLALDASMHMDSSGTHSCSYSHTLDEAVYMYCITRMQWCQRNHTSIATPAVRGLCRPASSEACHGLTFSYMR